MDSIDLRKKTGFTPSFGLSRMLPAAAFILGCVCTALLRTMLTADIMSIVRTVKAAGWITLAALLAADCACIVMPGARALCVLLSAACGASAAGLSYLYSDLKPFSAEFYVFAAAIFTFAAAAAYVSERVFALSPRLRRLIRGDRRLRYELNVFCAVSSALMLAAIVLAAVFILL